MELGRPDQPTVKSAMRTLDLIEYVVARPAGVVAQEIATALAIPVSSLSYLLATLVERTYLERDGRRYFAGPGLARLRQEQGELPLIDRARPMVKALRSRSNETASFFVLNGWWLEAAVTEPALQTLRYFIEVGSRTPLHAVSAGKAILAALAPDQLDRYFAETKRERVTEHTVTSQPELMRQIELTRSRGWASTHDEYTLGISGIGAAIRVAGAPVAAISVGIPSSRLSPRLEQIVVAQVVNACEALSSGWIEPERCRA